MLSLWYDAVLDWGLNLGPPILEASTLPLGYRGGSCSLLISNVVCTLDSYVISYVLLRSDYT